MNRRIRIILLAISLLLVIGTLGWLTHVLLVQAEETGHSEQRIRVEALEIPRALSRGDYDGAKETALWYDQLFGRGNYFLELQDHGPSIPRRRRTWLSRGM